MLRGQKCPNANLPCTGRQSLWEQDEELGAQLLAVAHGQQTRAPAPDIQLQHASAPYAYGVEPRNLRIHATVL